MQVQICPPEFFPDGAPFIHKAKGVGAGVSMEPYTIQSAIITPFGPKLISEEGKSIS